MKKLVVASIWGSIVEWYDFSLIGALAPVLSTLFFADQNELTSLLKLFFVFAVGFIARPIGALFFGRYGDKHERIDGLTRSLIITSLSTLLIGLLPSYNQIGVLATILLVILRITQGLGASGEHAGAITLLYESKTVKSNFVVSLSVVGIMLGMVMGFGATALIYSIFSNGQIYQWAWRMPFLFGGIIGLLGVLFRMTIKTEYSQENLVKTVLKRPLYELIKNSKSQLLIALGIYWFSVVIFYATYFFIPSIVISKYHQNAQLVAHLRFVNMLLYLILLVFFSYLTNFVSLRKMMLSALVATIILSIPCFYYGMSSSPTYFYISQLLLTVINTLYLAPIAVSFSGLFKREIRYSGIGLSINMSAAIFGGTTPVIMLMISRYSGDPVYSVVYLLIAAIIAVFCVKNKLFLASRNTLQMANL